MNPAESFLAGYPAPIQAITRKLRGLIAQATPGAREVLDARQNHFGYSYSGRYSERVMYLVPMAEYVRLGFFWGGYLPDPQGLLVGEGKRLRHIKVFSLAEAGRPALKALLIAAWADAKANRKQTIV
jgi:hypothetical protein